MFLLDTNVLSELPKPRPAPRVVQWVEVAPPASLFVSVLTIGEILRGIRSLNRREPMRAMALQGWLDRVRSDFASRVLPVDEGVVEAWASLAVGRSLPAFDSLIMATAQIHGLTLVTRDVRHPRALGVPFLNPWES